LSLIYAKEENHLEAIKCLEKALELDMTNGQIYYNLSCSYAKAGLADKAKACFETS